MTKASVDAGIAARPPLSVSRRGFLGLAGTTLGLFALSPLLALAPGAARRAKAAAIAGLSRLVIVNLKGGNDGLNTVIPSSVAEYFSRRPTIAVPDASSLSLASGPASTTAMRLHPSLPKLAQLWAEGSVAVVNKVGYPAPNLSHFSSEDIWSFGIRGAGGTPTATSGWVARLADRLAVLPGASAVDVVGVGLPSQKDFAGGSAPPLTVDSLSRFRLDTDTGDGSANNHRLRLEVIRSKLLARGRAGLEEDVRRATSSAHDLSTQVQAAVASFTTGGIPYPTTSLGNRMRDVATLIQGGFGTRVFYTGYGGFDTHSNQVGTGGDHAPLLTQLDDALGAFADHMKAMGVWGDTAIVVISEFGRRNYENGSSGTDHGHANCVLVVGGAVTGGLFGPAITSADLQQEYLPASIDFRAVYGQLLAAHLGVPDVGAIFPEASSLAGSPGNFV